MNILRVGRLGYLGLEFDLFTSDGIEMGKGVMVQG